MVDNPQTEVEIINAVGAAAPVAIVGATTSVQIGNVSDALKVAITANQVVASSFNTYSANITGLAVATSPTDVFTLTGSASTTVQILAIHISGNKTNTGFQDVLLLKRSTANSGGTSSAPTRVPHDSVDPAATATVLAYTANPTLGTLVGAVFSEKIFIPSGTAASASSSPTIEILTDFSKPITLRGVNEVFAINFNGVTMSGSNMDLSITWIEF